jgi:thiol-disulfide isomerase/thioredoxin
MTASRVGVAALAVALIGLTACAGGGTATAPPTVPSTVEELPTMGPETFAELVARQRGTPVLVNIWGSWCPPCEEETPDIVQAYHRWGDRVRFIGVDAQDNRADAIEFLHRHEVPYPSVFDPSNEIAVSYGVFAPPDTLFFDADGNLVKTVTGLISAEDLRANLRAIAP